MYEKQNFYSDIRISRTGTTEVLVPSPLEVSEDAPTLPSDEGRARRMAHILASQTFYFVKDLGHRHQHHTTSTDQIIHLWPYSGSDDYTWREQTLYGIYRRVIQIKRDRHLATFNDSLGLIAYARAFADISKDELDYFFKNLEHTDEEAPPKLPTYYYDYTIDSINSTRSHIERAFEIKQRRRDIISTILLSIVGVIISLMGLLSLSTYKSQIKPNHTLIYILEFAIERPFISMGLVGLAGLLSYLVMCLRVAEPTQTQIFITRIFQPFPKSVLATILIAIMSASFWAFVSILLHTPH